jgi:hypothetical protein
MFFKKNDFDGPWDNTRKKLMQQGTIIAVSEIVGENEKDVKELKRVTNILQKLVTEVANDIWKNAVSFTKQESIVNPTPGMFTTYKSDITIPKENIIPVIREVLEEEGFYDLIDFKEEMESRFKKAAEVLPKVKGDTK